MRVLQVHNRYREPGGEDRVSALDAAALVAGGHEVRCFEAGNPRTAVRSAITLAAAPWNPRQARRLERAVEGWEPDVAHVHNTWFSLSPAVIAALKRKGIPTVISLHNYRLFCVDASFFRNGQVCTDCVGKMPWRGVVHACYRDSRPQSAVAAATATIHRKRGTWAGADALLAPSKWIRDMYVTSGFDPARIRVSPWFTEDPGPRTGPPSASKDVIYLGRLEETKGVLQLIRAWREAGEAVGEMRLRIIGDGSLRGEVEASAGDGIEFTPWLERSELNATLLRSRAVVCPSIWHEAFGQVVIEGFAAGLPVLASDRGDLPELVGELDPAMSVAAEDRASWAKALAGLDDDRRVDRLGAAARELFESRYSPEPGLRRLEDVYAEARSFPSAGRAVR